MATRNDITGDLIQTKLGNNEAYEANWDKIFGKKKATVAEAEPTPDQPVEPTQLDLFDEERADRIGANGNEGLHYEETK